jgi:glycosyltransferase involved in cell wall biosynthesis
VRILHICSARSLGGGERHLADLASALAGRGHRVYAALPARSPLREELASLPGQNIFTLRLRHALDLSSAVELARLLREHQIEILHAHVARDYPLAAMATKLHRRTKLVITRHVLFPLNRLHSITLSHVARVIAVSGGVARVLSAQNIFPANKITIIPNGSDFHRLDAGLEGRSRGEFRRRFGIPPEGLLVGTVGELKKEKGHEDFLRAAALIVKERADAHFVIAGADATREGGYGASLERLIVELNLTGRVHLTGWLEEVALLFAALDVYVSASHTESFGLSIVEAMACSLPVVATATEGAREIIDREEIGVLVPVRDVEVLARAVLRLLDDAGARTHLGSNASVSVRERFSLARMVDATERVYGQVTGKEMSK